MYQNSTSKVWIDSGFGKNLLENKPLDFYINEYMILLMDHNTKKSTLLLRWLSSL